MQIIIWRGFSYIQLKTLFINLALLKFIFVSLTIIFHLMLCPFTHVIQACGTVRRSETQDSF